MIDNITARLDLIIVKEYKQTILFRSGCAMGGPCEYILIDKSIGKRVKEFDQLICIESDWSGDNLHKNNFSFVVYLLENKNPLIIYFIDTKKTLIVPFTARFTSYIPEISLAKWN